jgi:Putative Ig domain
MGRLLRSAVVVAFVAIWLIVTSSVASGQGVFTPAGAARSSGLVVSISGLPPGVAASVAVRGPGLVTVLRRSGALPHVRPGRYVFIVRKVKIGPGHRVRGGSTALPAAGRVAVRVRAGRRTVVHLQYGTIINPNVRRLTVKPLTVRGNARNPSGLAFSRTFRVAVGAILTSGPTSRLPAGLFHRVTAIRRSSTRVIVTLKPARLMQAFPQLDINSSVHFASGTTAVVRGVSPRLAPPIGSLGIGNFRCQLPVADSTLAATQSFGVSAVVQVHIPTFFGIPVGLPDGKLALTLKASAALDAFLRQNTGCSATLNLPAIPADIPVGPVVVPVFIQPGLFGSATIGSDIKAHARAGLTVTAGMTFNGTSVHNISGATANATASASGAGQIAIGASVRFAVGVAAVADVHLDARPNLAFTVALDGTCSLALVGGSRVGISLGPFELNQNLPAPSLTLYRCPRPPPPPHPSVTVTNPGAQAGRAGTPVSLQIHASDTDGGTLSYSAVDLPAGLSMDARTGLISGSPTTLGTSSVGITATDTTGPSATATFNWTISASPTGSCEASSSVFVMTTGTNVVAYVPKGNWASTSTGLSLVNVEGSSVTPTLISTPNVVNSAASDPFTGETVATANNTDVYLLNGTTVLSTLSSGGSGTIDFSGGSPTDAGVAMDSTHNRAVITLSVGGEPGFQLLDLNSNTFGSPVTSPTGEVSEDPLIDPFRNLLLSASENGNFEIADLSNPAAPAFYEDATGGGELDSTGEDCSTGIALAPAEFSDPSSVYIADLTQATFTPGSPAGTWSAPSQIQTLSESSLSAGASAVAVAQGTHIGVLAGEFEGNQITAFALPTTSGSGTPSITDWVTCGIDNTPDSNAWSEGDDPHTMTAYQTPNGGDAIGLFENETAGWLARVDLTQLLNPSIVPRDTDGHACAAGTLSSSVESFIAVP